MRNINDFIFNKMNRLEQFTLRTPQGEVLWDMRAPGLHVILNAWKYINSLGERGRETLVHHSVSGDFFNKTYDILTRAGVTPSFDPRVWAYIRELNKYADKNTDPGIKASTNIQLFVFLQDYLEEILYRKYIAATDRPFTGDRDVLRKLLVAADSFVVHNDRGRVDVFAGYPWFNEGWGRDTFISCAGLFLATGRISEAKSVFIRYASLQRDDGLIPNRIFPDGCLEYNSADASLWFCEALNRYYLSSRDEEKNSFIKEMLPVVNRILDGYMKTSGSVYRDADHLVAVPGQWTWMDAVVDGRPVTPRSGKPVEVEALFYNALGIADRFNRLVGGRKSAELYGKMREDVADTINSRFFRDIAVYPFDVVDGGEAGAKVRPNAVFLLSLSDGAHLLTPDKRQTVLQGIERDLLTPYGLRSLAPSDPAYRGLYDTAAPLAVKDLAYHQGTAWPYLLAPYITACRNAAPDTFIPAAAERTRHLVEYVREHMTLPELFNGNAPHVPGGAFSQAWSVAALIEILDLLAVSSRQMPLK